MGTSIHGTPDAITDRIADAVRKYTDVHSSAEALVYRYSPVSVRVRVVDPDFQGKSRSERHREVWPLLRALDEDALGDLTMVLLITPEEQKTSIADRDFTNGFFTPDLNRVLAPSQPETGSSA